MLNSKICLFFKKTGPNPASFCLFSVFSNDKYSTNLTINHKSVDGVHGIRTWGGRMVGTDESTQNLFITSASGYLRTFSILYNPQIKKQRKIRSKEQRRSKNLTIF